MVVVGGDEPEVEVEMDAGVAGEMAAAAASLKKRGQVEFKREDYHAAADLFSRAAMLEPKNAVHQSNRSIAYLKDGRWAEALEAAQNAHVLDPAWGKAHYRIGAALLVLGRAAEAVEAFKAALAVEPDSKAAKKALKDAQTKAAAAAAAAAVLALEREQEEASRRPVAAEACMPCAAGAAGDGATEGEGPYKGWPVGLRVLGGARGRGVCALRALKTGELVHSAPSWAAVVTDELLKTVCSCCLKVPPEDTHPEGLSISCKDCGVANYCSAECMERAAPLHAHECESVFRIVKMTQGKSETRGARMLIRVLAQYKIEKGGSGGGSGWRSNRADVEKLLSHLDSMTDERLAGLRGIAGGIAKLPVAEGLGLTERQITRIVAQLQCNSQGMIDLNHHRRGDLLTAPADFNHSCEPNVFVSFHGEDVHYRALRDVRTGEELCITYTDLMLPRAVRRAKLKQSHFFDCNCSRCSDTGARGKDALVAAFADRGAAASMDGDALKEAEKQAILLFEGSLKAKGEKDYAGSRGKLEEILSKFGPLLGEAHWLRYNTEHHLMSACNATGDPMAAVDHAQKAIAVLKIIYPANHSEHATMHNALAHTQWGLYRRHTENSEVGRAARHAAKQAFGAALRVVDVCYGAAHEAHVQIARLRDMLEEDEPR